MQCLFRPGGIRLSRRALRVSRRPLIRANGNPVNTVKRLFPIIAAIIIGGLSIGSLTGTSGANEGTDPTASDPLNATYWIEGEAVGLVDGRRERPAAPGSAITVHTLIWQQPIYGDLDGDGDVDAALLLIHDPGGSGTFVYVAAAINADGRYRGTNTVLLGDRIEPRRIAIRNHAITVEYTDRRPDEPYSAAPSVDRTMILRVHDGKRLEKIH